MKKSTITWIIVGAVALILVLYFVGGYNRFVTLDQNVQSKWSEVENQYQRQADVIPNLASIVQSAVGAETSYIKEVTEARSRWQEARTQYDKDVAGVQMNEGIAALVNAVAVSEAYPTLQANRQYVALTDEAVGAQNRITTARGRYIEAIQSYNTATKRFPSNVIAGIFGFEEKQYYQAEEGSMRTPELGNGTLP